MELGKYGTTGDDLSALASAEAEKLIKEIPFLVERKDLKAEILANADGMFIYIRLLADSVIATKSASRSDIEELLAHSPTGLDAMYEKYFVTLVKRNSSLRNEMAIQVLQWLLTSERISISFDSMREIFQISPGDDDFDPTKSVSDIEAELQQSLGILVD